jgi:dihydrolipoamide dehydrogenase
MPLASGNGFDLAVIGSGPAGYTAAIRASELGARVAIVEQTKTGGACLNHACIPTKFLRYAAEELGSIDKAARYGINTSPGQIEWQVLQQRRQALIDEMGRGLADQLNSSQVSIISGKAKAVSNSGIEVLLNDGSVHQLGAQRTIIATGSSPALLDMPGSSEVIFPSDLLEAGELPRSICFIGGGPVGVELASIFSRLGSRTSIVELMPGILPQEDREAVGQLERGMKREGISIYTGASVSRVEKSGAKKQVILSSNDKEQKVEADIVVLCIGNRPDAGNLIFEEAMPGQGPIEVDKRMHTGKERLYAAGDVTGKALYAYVAMMQGRAAAENALGGNSPVDYDVVPRCVFSFPALSSVGATEDRAKAMGIDYSVGRFPFSANSAATIIGERRGMVKLISESKTHRIVGVHILGPEAPCMIHEAALAVKMKATVDDIKGMLHIHPTPSETLWEAALDISF